MLLSYDPAKCLPESMSRLSLAHLPKPIRRCFRAGKDPDPANTEASVWKGIFKEKEQRQQPRYNCSKQNKKKQLKMTG